jgi:hypothetical protein
MKDSFVKNLADHLFEEVVENSYYNDECDVDCYTPDFDEAYHYIVKHGPISKKELEEKHQVEGVNEDGEAIKYSGIDLLKLAVLGDFDNDHNSHSSELGNLKMCLKLIENTKGDRSIWEYMKNDNPVKRKGYSEHEYKKNICDNNNLAMLVGSRAESAAYRLGKEGIEIAAEIGKKLRGYKGFETKEKCNLIGSSLKSNTLKESNVKKIATLIKNEDYRRLSETQSYDLRQATSRYIVYGRSGDPVFDNIVDNTKGIKEIIATKGDSLEI